MSDNEQPLNDSGPDNETPPEEKAPAAPSSRPEPPPMPPSDREAAEFPDGFLGSVDYMLHHPEEIVESMRRDRDLSKLSQVFFLIALAMSALYGAVMGATNLLQGSVMSFDAKLLMIVVSGVKVPMLFLLTLLIVLPPIYVSNALVGGKMSFRQVLAILLAATAIMSTILASMASVALFFSLTSTSYHFLKLLHVLFFLYAGLVGVGYCEKSIRAIGAGRTRARTPARTPAWVFMIWLLLYMFVGTQLAWVLRPFVGSPNMEFQFFRPRYGNFYESVLQSIRNLTEE